MIDINTLLDNGATYRSLAQDEILFSEGTPCNFYYQLVSGKIKQVNISEDGKEFIQHIATEGEPTGEIALFDHGLYATTGISMTPAVVLRLHRVSFDNLLKKDVSLLLAFNRLLAHHLRIEFRTLNELAFQDPEQRILSLLKRFRESQKNICPVCNKLELTRQEIAAMTGLRIETVIRTIRSLHTKGLLSIDKGKVYCATSMVKQ